MGTVAIAGSIKKTQDKDGMLRRALERIIQLYTDKSHFIYELLQNAEDAEAKTIRFVQYPDRLEVLHDGKPFTKNNLDSLCNIGKSDKTNELNQIGEFGVGFKSVFGICDTVRLYSVPRRFRDQSRCGDAVPFAVEISDFIIPEDIEETTVESGFTTKFIFPYVVGQTFSGFSSFDELNEAVSGKLQNLGITTLLFMKNLETIEYEILIDRLPIKGEYLLEKKAINDHCLLASAIGINTQKKEEDISYLRFTRPIDSISTRTVDIAFPVRINKDGSYECLKPRTPFVSVYFPTETVSMLNFIVQGPYRTTPNRSSIPADNIDNKLLAKETANLLRDSLIELRELGKLNMSFVKALPVSEKSFDTFKLFIPLYEMTKALFSTQAIIPCQEGGYSAARYAMISRQERLPVLISDELLTTLINDGYKYHWLPSFLTETNREYEQVYRFLTGELKINIIRPEDLVVFFAKNPDFLLQMTDDWLVSLYTLLENVPYAFSRNKNEAIMLTSEYIKTSSGKFVAAYRKTDKQYIPNVFLPTGRIHSDSINSVDMKIYNQCRHFFDDILQIQQPDEYQVIIEDIKKHYREFGSIDKNNHIEDIKALIKYEKYDDYKSEVKSIIKDYMVVMCKDGKYHSPFDTLVYLPLSTDGINIEGYFKNVITSISYLDADFYTKHGLSLESLLLFGVRNSILTGDQIEEGVYDTGKKGAQPKWWTQGEFRWKLSIESINTILKYISDNPSKKDSILKSQAIFKVLMNNEPRLVGTVRIGGNTQNLENETCDLIKILRGEKNRGWNGKWLFSESMELVSQKDISKHDINPAIYGKVKNDTVVYEILGFKKTEADQVDDLKKTIPQKQLDAYFESELRQRFGISSADLIERYGETAQSSLAIEDDLYQFPVVRIKNWDMLRKHAREMLVFANPVKYEKRLLSIKVGNHQKDVKAYLHNMYRFDGTYKYACQMCHDSCSDVHCVELFERPDDELDPMNLCLCPNCAAKYKKLRGNSHLMSQLRDKITTMDERGVTEVEHVDLTLVDTEIWFTQTHFAEIQELIKLSDEVKKTGIAKEPVPAPQTPPSVQPMKPKASISVKTAPQPQPKPTYTKTIAEKKNNVKPSDVLIKKGTGKRIVANTTVKNSPSETQSAKRHLMKGDKVSVKKLGICTVIQLSPGWVRVQTQDKKKEWFQYPGSYDNGDIKLL